MRGHHEAIGQRAHHREWSLALVLAAVAVIGGLGLSATRGSWAAEAGLDDVRRLIGDAACAGDDECRTVAVGTQACGGPAAFLAWSTRRTSREALDAAVARYDASRGAAVARGGAISTCQVLTDPGATCVRSPQAGAGTMGRCTLGSAGSRPQR